MNKAFKINHATWSVRRKEKTRLLVLDRLSGKMKHKVVRVLPELFGRGDLFVVNDAATIPASLKGRFAQAEIEIRLAQRLDQVPGEFSHWRAVVFGEGDWRLPTEKREELPLLKEGDLLEFGSDIKAPVLAAQVLKIETEVSNRLLQIEFKEKGPLLWSHFYSLARPIQYSYLESNLAIWDQQTIFAGPPMALEPPSASFPFTWEILARLEARGVEVLRISHATGISNTGVKKIDQLLPFPEESRIPFSVQERLKNAKNQGRRIVALGTGVVRALEAWGEAKTSKETILADNKISAESRPKIVTGLITGFHEPQASHLDLLGAFFNKHALLKAYGEAAEFGYLWHEYGDVCLII